MLWVIYLISSNCPKIQLVNRSLDPVQIIRLVDSIYCSFNDCKASDVLPLACPLVSDFKVMTPRGLQLSLSTMEYI